MGEKLYNWINHPELLDKESLYELRSMLAIYPYFQTVRALYLKNLYLLNEKDFNEEISKSAVYINDRKKLFSILDGMKYSDFVGEQIECKPKKEVKDRTSSLIDAFLSSDKEDVEKIKLSMEASNDYASLLLSEDENQNEEVNQTQMRGQDLIDKFVNKQNESEQESGVDIIEQKLREKDAQESEAPLEEGVDDEDESYFTETLAKIYIKQKRYDKAMEIIKKLNLKYPKKNVYFADQIRFLEKLIINTKSK